MIISCIIFLIPPSTMFIFRSSSERLHLLTTPSSPWQTQCDFYYSFILESDPWQRKLGAQTGIFHIPVGADFMIWANCTFCPFLACPPALSPHHPFSSRCSFPRTSSINIRVNCQHITVASVASMHSFTSAGEQTVKAAANGNILPFTGQRTLPLWLFLLICGTL